jgi:6-bladed beta-propeller
MASWVDPVAARISRFRWTVPPRGLHPSAYSMSSHRLRFDMTATISGRFYRRMASVFLLATGVTASTGYAWAGDSSDIPVVENPSTPPGEHRVIHTELLWSVGDDEENDPLMGYISKVLADDQGRVFLLDAQLSQIYVYGPDGEFVQSFGAEGDGPGEFRKPQGMFFLSADRIAVTQMMPPKICVFRTDGEILGTLDLPHEGMAQMVTKGESSGSWAVVEQRDMRMSGSGVTTVTQLLRLDESDGIAAMYLEHSTTQDFQRMKVGDVDEEDFSNMWGLLPDGRVVVSPRYHSYEIHFFELGGSLARIARRDYEPVAVSKKQLAKTRERLEKMSERSGQNFEIVEEPFRRAIEGLLVRPGGEIWVRPALESDEDDESTPALGPFDVFDSQGSFTHTTEVDFDLRPKRDRVHILGDLIVVVREAVGAAASYYGGLSPDAADFFDNDDLEDPEPMRIEAYRLRLGAGK